jgi:hypothetical protein
MSSTILLPPREQLCNRYCCNKHLHLFKLNQTQRGQPVQNSVLALSYLADLPSGPFGCKGVQIRHY